MQNAFCSPLRSLLSVALGLGSLAIAPAARAEQFVLLDVTFTFTKADADNATPSKSHYYVKADRLSPDMPVDWTQPIDYRNGRVHVRTEVMDKPAGSAETRWTLCYIARKGIDAGYGCSNTAAYKEEGVWDFEQGMTEWWQNDNIDWTQGIKQMDLVMKDGNGVFAHTMPDPEHWFPTTLRITMIQVSAGSSYDPSLVPGITSGAGGSGSGGMGTGGDAAIAGSAGSAGGDPTSGGSGVAGAAQLAGAGGTSSLPVAGTAGAANSAGSSPAPGGGSTSAAPSSTEDGAGCSIGGARAPYSNWAPAGLLLALAAASRRRKL